MYPKLTVAAIAIGSPILYAIHLHRHLSRLIHHETQIGTAPASIVDFIDSLPPDVRRNPSRYHMFYDVASKSVATALLPSFQDPYRLLTTYLRHTMSHFAHLPQAYLLRLVARSAEANNSFNSSHIQTSSFEKGDLVCGIYHVEMRSATKIEFAILPPKFEPEPPFEGRLVICIDERDDQSVFSTTTVMWRRSGEVVVMPLEKRPFKWMHELTSWWLLDTGTRWLVEQQGTS